MSSFKRMISRWPRSSFVFERQNISSVGWSSNVPHSWILCPNKSCGFLCALFTFGRGISLRLVRADFFLLGRSSHWKYVDLQFFYSHVAWLMYECGCCLEIVQAHAYAFVVLHLFLGKVFLSWMSLQISAEEVRFSHSVCKIDWNLIYLKWWIISFFSIDGKSAFSNIY